jgi:prepilin-type N-terminal cleavage/methylation domain-containing protein
MNKNKKALTLVELIVVLIVLAILSTILFFSIQSRFRDARDSVRIVDISNIDKQLQIALSQKWRLPKPDEFIEITASGILISYQWIAWRNTLDSTLFSNWAKDPLNDSYYIYTTNKNLTKYKVLWFLEEQRYLNLPAYRKLNDFSNRKIFSKWSEIWVVLNANTKNPVENILDVFNTEDSYDYYFSNSEILSWTWLYLRWWIAWWSLVWYRHFDKMTGSGFIDYSVNNSPSLFNWWITLSWWVLWNAMYLNWIDWEFNVDSIVGLWDTSNSPHTISAWLYVNNIFSCWTSNSCRQWILLLWDKWSWSHHWLIWWIFEVQFWIWDWPQTKPNIQTWEWMHIAIVYDGLKSLSYVNWEITREKSLEQRVIEMNIKDAKLNIGKNQQSWQKYFSWAIDDLHIYNRALSVDEVNILYKIWK